MIMNKIYIPEGYTPKLDAYDTQRAIAYIKGTFQHTAVNIFTKSAWKTENVTPVLISCSRVYFCRIIKSHPSKLSFHKAHLPFLF